MPAATLTFRAPVRPAHGNFGVNLAFRPVAHHREDPPLLIAQNQTGGVGCLKGGEVGFGLFAQPNPFQSALPEIMQGLGDVGDPGNRDAQQRSAAGLDRIFIDWRGVVILQNEASSAEALRGSGDGAEVADIGHAIEDDQEDASARLKAPCWTSSSSVWTIERPTWGRTNRPRCLGGSSL